MNRFFGSTGYLLVVGVLVGVALVAAWVVIGTYGFVRLGNQSLRNTVDELGPSWSEDGTRVAFAADEDGSYDIFVQSVDGDDRTNITNSAEESSHPVWSPDGSWISYISKGSRGYDIYVVRPDGSGRSNLTNFPSLYTDIAWSPDGTKIAFVSNRDVLQLELLQNPQQGALPRPERRSPDIYVIDINGRDAARLTFDLASDRRPQWSPDGGKLIFQSTRDGNSEIYTIKADGSGLARLTDNDVTDVDPMWSPDGTRIAFATARPQTEFQEHLEENQSVQPFANIGRSNLRKLATGLNFDIYMMNADGSRAINLTNSPNTDDTRPVWSPDGSFVAFDGAYLRVPPTAPGKSEVYVLQVDGSDGVIPITQPTTPPETHEAPAWSPDGRHIGYVSRDVDSVRVRTVEVRSEEPGPRGSS